jgi:hypothetical protein
MMHIVMLGLRQMVESECLGNRLKLRDFVVMKVPLPGMLRWLATGILVSVMCTVYVAEGT